MSWPSFWAGFASGVYALAVVIVVAFFYAAHAKHVEGAEGE